MGNKAGLWKVLWEHYYDTYYFEMLVDATLNRWHTFDLVARILIAFTASGSAIAGWALWSDEAYKSAWLFAAGAASVISVLHTTVGANEKLKNLTSLYAELIPVRIQYEALREDFSIYHEINITEQHEKAKELKAKYQNMKARFEHGFLCTENLRNNTQKKLNLKLGVNN